VDFYDAMWTQKQAPTGGRQSVNVKSIELNKRTIKKEKMRKLMLMAVAAFGLAANSHASLVSMYYYDIARFPSTYNNGEIVTLYGGNYGGEFYVIHNNRVEAVYSASSGYAWPTSTFGKVMSNALENTGQRWISSGNNEWVTSDGRLYAKLFWYGQAHVLRIAYKNHISRFGLWANYVRPNPHPHKVTPKRSLPQVDLNV
jgi:hypothetical protein